MRDSQPVNRQNPQIDNRDLIILLWDIDGTLIRSRVNGSFKRYFLPTMRKVYGSAGNFESMQFSGMTDTQIIYESLRGEGFTPERIFEKKADLIETFKAEMSAAFAEDPHYHEILPGVPEILRETDRHPRMINALLTGNLSVAAEIKLRSVDLWHYFDGAPNAFGEISHNRSDLAVEAGKLFDERYGYDFAPEQFIVIGDTPNDIACARHFGAKAVAVATGRGQAVDELAANEPDILLEDLSDTARVLEILENL
jgi:phosphoglycolate phosphatase-like HAD superfamily hydrolase